jgi:hypothetical protein
MGRKEERVMEEERKRNGARLEGVEKEGKRDCNRSNVLSSTSASSHSSPELGALSFPVLIIKRLFPYT